MSPSVMKRSYVTAQLKFPNRFAAENIKKLQKVGIFYLGPSASYGPLILQLECKTQQDGCHVCSQSRTLRGCTMAKILEEKF